jgi:hypothetical protein
MLTRRNVSDCRLDALHEILLSLARVRYLKPGSSFFDRPYDLSVDVRIASDPRVVIGDDRLNVTSRLEVAKHRLKPRALKQAA